jgi:hypothetical protein
MKTAMIRSLSWQQLVLATFTVATLALLLYTVGAPSEMY